MEICKKLIFIIKDCTDFSFQKGKNMAEFTFEIEEKLLVLSENDKGWTKELNRVSFNGAPAKYDIRTWSPDHSKMGKGITLTNDEFEILVKAFQAPK